MSASNGLSAAAIQEIAVYGMLSALKQRKTVGALHLKEALAKVKKHMQSSKTGLERVSSGSVGFSTAPMGRHDAPVASVPHFVVDNYAYPTVT